MTLPCAVLCLLALSLDFKASPDIQKCSYCAQMRALSLHCEQKPLVCAEWDPDSLIYCLSRDERPWGRDALKRSTRCISHANLMNQSSLPIDRDALQHSLSLLPNGHQCTFEASQKCECPDCPLEGMGADNLEGSKETMDLGRELENIALLLDKLIVEENGQKNNWRIEEPAPIRKTTRRTLPPKLMASIPLRPLPKGPKGESTNFRLIPLPADFLHSSAPSPPKMIFISISLLFPFLCWPIHFSLHHPLFFPFL